MRIDQQFHSLSDCLRLQANRNPDDRCLTFAQRTWTFRQLEDWVETVARNLWNHGIRPGSRIATFQNRNAHLIAGFLAICRTGGVPVPVNVRLPKGPLAVLLNIVRAEWVVADQSYYPLLQRHASELPPRNRWIICNEPRLGGAAWSDFECPAPTVQFPRQEPEDVCYIHFTSGTSRQPKGVLTTHENIWANTESAIAALGLRDVDLHLNLFAPFAHPHEILARPLHLGGTMVLTDLIRPDSVLSVIHDNEVSCVMGVPTVYDSLFRPFLTDKRLKCVRLFESGGGVTPEDLIGQFEDTLGVPITPVWGSTETSGIALAAPPEGDRPPGAIGLLCPGFEARILNEEGDEVFDEPGQLMLRGKSIMKGYLHGQDDVHRVSQDEWYCTGDLFSRDGNGFFYFRGRVDEMFKHRGFKVYPCEIEQILLHHPAVSQAAVIGRRTVRGEREPVAFVSCKPGHSVAPGELRSFCRKRLAPYLIPREVIVRETLPATGSGKIRKGELLAEGNGQ